MLGKNRKQGSKIFAVRLSTFVRIARPPAGEAYRAASTHAPDVRQNRRFIAEEGGTASGADAAPALISGAYLTQASECGRV